MISKKEKIIEELSLKYDYNKGDIKVILDYPFKYVASIIKNDSYDKILINGFCKFESNNYRRSLILKDRAKKEKEKNKE